MIVMGPKKPKMKIVTIRLGHIQQAKIIKLLNYYYYYYYYYYVRLCLTKIYFKKKPKLMRSNHQRIHWRF